MVCVFSNSLLKTFLQSYEIIVIILINIYNILTKSLCSISEPLSTSNCTAWDDPHKKRGVIPFYSICRKIHVNNKLNNSYNNIFDYWNVWRSIWVKLNSTRWSSKICNISSSSRVCEVGMLLSHYLVSFYNSLHFLSHFGRASRSRFYQPAWLFEFFQKLVSHDATSIHSSLFSQSFYYSRNLQTFAAQVENV